MLASSVHALPSRIMAASSSLLRAERGLVVVVLGEDTHQGLAVYVNRGRIVVNGFAEVPADAAVRALRTRIGRVLDKLETDIRRVVVVSGEVRAFPLDLAAPRRKRGAMEHLVAAARREFPDYLDMDGASALLGVLPLYQPPDDSGFEDDDDPLSARIPAMAFAVSRRHASAVEAAVRACGRRFAGLLPQECFAFAMGQGPDSGLAFQQAAHHAIDDEGDGNLRVLACATPFELHGARLSGHGLERFAVEALGEGVDRAGAMGRLVAQLLEPGETGRVVLGGGGGSGGASLGASVAGGSWGRGDEMERVDGPEEMPPQYMTAMGAAVAALRGGQFLLLYERTSAFTRLKAKGLLLPLGVVLALALAGGGMYGHLRLKLSSLESAIAQLEERKKELSDQRKRGGDLMTRYAKLKKDVSDAKTAKEMLENGFALRVIRLAQLLRGLVVDTPPEIMITRFEKMMNDTYMLEGQGTSTTVISQYLLLLRNTPFVEDTRLIRSAVISAPSPARGRGTAQQEAGPLPLGFSIRMTLGGDNG